MKKKKPWTIQVSILEIDNILFLKIIQILYHFIYCYPIIPILVFTFSIIPY